MSELPKPMSAPGNTLEAALVARAYHRQWRRDMEAVRDWLRDNEWLSMHSDPHYYNIGRAFAEQIEAALKEETI